MWSTPGAVFGVGVAEHTGYECTTITGRTGSSCLERARDRMRSTAIFSASRSTTPGRGPAVRDAHASRWRAPAADGRGQPDARSAAVCVTFEVATSTQPLAVWRPAGRRPRSVGFEYGRGPPSRGSTARFSLMTSSLLTEPDCRLCTVVAFPRRRCRRGVHAAALSCGAGFSGRGCRPRPTPSGASTHRPSLPKTRTLEAARETPSGYREHRALKGRSACPTPRRVRAGCRWARRAAQRPRSARAEDLKRALLPSIAVEGLFPCRPLVAVERPPLLRRHPSRLSSPRCRMSSRVRPRRAGES